MTAERARVEAAWVGLMSLDGVGPRGLWDVLGAGGPVVEWERRRHEARAGFDAEREHRRHLDAGLSMSLHGDADHPSIDVGDPHVPPVLWWRGRFAGRPARPTVGIVGTRRASRAGLELAREFGRDLTASGCSVVSGLALGIDAAAHAGALAADGAAPVAVVGCGHDVVYPRRNASLWAQLAARGAIVSEYPLGTPPAPWRFPARNRILVACCDALVVVESHERGGSLITAGIAGARGVPVLAVPGSIRSATAVGTNRLIADGCQPCLGVDDVLDALGFGAAPQLGFPAAAAPGVAVAPGSGSGAAVPTSDAEDVVLDALGWVPRSVDELADACGALSLGAVALAVAGLLGKGLVAETDGRLERVR